MAEAPSLPPSALGRLRALASDLLARAGLAGRAGLTFNGKRDLYAALGYQRVIDVKDYRARYDRGDIAARIVEALAKATWRGGGELVEDEDPNVETPFEQAWEALNQRLQVWPTLTRTDILAGIGHYAVLLLGLPGPLDQEATPVSKPEQLAYLQPFSEQDAQIEAYDTAPESPRFGLPVLYRIGRIDPSGPSKTGVGRTGGQLRRVHWSRVIHVPDGILDDNVNGQPRLERVWNRLDDLDKVVGGGSEAFWVRVHAGYQFDLDKDVELSAEEIKKLQDEIDEFLHGMRRSVRTRGVDMKAHSAQVADFSRAADSILTLISAATGIPKRILLGSERGELASSQDKTNWDERVTDRRTEFAGPTLVRPLIDRLIELKVLPAPAQYEVRWPQIQNLTETERAALADKLADVNSKMGETVITPDEIRDRVLLLPPLAEIDGEGDEDEGKGKGAAKDGATGAETNTGDEGDPAPGGDDGDA